MLPLLPLAILAVLRALPGLRPGVPWAARSCLVVFACYGIAATHDYSAASRARSLAAWELQRSGIGRDRISAGFEYDGWTELAHSGYVSVVRYNDLSVQDHAKGFWFWFWNHTPDLKPDFVVLNWTAAERPQGAGVRVDFRAWLPPFRRSAVVWRRSDLTGALQAFRAVALVR
jgi:hypothetical protein